MYGFSHELHMKKDAHENSEICFPVITYLSEIKDGSGIFKIHAKHVFFDTEGGDR